MLQSVTECYRVLQSFAVCYRVFLAHLLGPIFGLVIFVNGGRADGNRENVLFNDVVCHKGSNFGLSIYFKINLAIPRLFFLFVLGIEDLAVRCGSNAQGEGVNVSSDSFSPFILSTIIIFIFRIALGELPSYAFTKHFVTFPIWVLS